MTKYLLILVLFAALVTPVLGYGYGYCPDVNVTCQCDCSETVLPGFWKVPISEEIKCGVITIIGNGFILDQAGGKKDFFLINKIKRAIQVESCE